jgi:hypothetical protein
MTLRIILKAPTLGIFSDRESDHIHNTKGEEPLKSTKVESNQ